MELILCQWPLRPLCTKHGTKTHFHNCAYYPGGHYQDIYPGVLALGQVQVAISPTIVLIINQIWWKTTVLLYFDYRPVPSFAHDTTTHIVVSCARFRSDHSSTICHSKIAMGFDLWWKIVSEPGPWPSHVWVLVGSGLFIWQVAARSSAATITILSHWHFLGNISTCLAGCLIIFPAARATPPRMQ